MAIPISLFILRLQNNLQIITFKIPVKKYKYARIVFITSE